MDTLIYGPRGYYGHFALQMEIFIYASGILQSLEWILEEERRHWNLKVENMAINLPSPQQPNVSRKIKEDFSLGKNYSILYLTNCTNVLEFVYFDFVYPP